MTNPYHKHTCPVCGKPTFGTPKESGVTWDICPDCDNRQNQNESATTDHRGETKGQPSA
ncbi:unnamed protein product [marine sediment metagenome]|uniref:Cysteine-rich CPCC domain-containing protein n=1 Tax=marine sediment metagenome TaxID=412755 RepID=X1KIY2_9ZZZZ